jgi:hypothetical protein
VDDCGGVFIGLAAVYVSEFFAILGVSFAGKALGIVHLVDEPLLADHPTCEPPH